MGPVVSLFFKKKKRKGLEKLYHLKHRIRHRASFLSWMVKADVIRIIFLLTFTRFSLSSLKGSDVAQLGGFSLALVKMSESK